MLLGLEELEKLHSCKMCVRLFSNGHRGKKFHLHLFFNNCEKCQLTDL